MIGMKHSIALAVLASLMACKADEPPTRSKTNSFSKGATTEKVIPGEVEMKTGDIMSQPPMSPAPTDGNQLPGPSPTPAPAPTPEQNQGNSSSDLPSDPNKATATGAFPGGTVNLKEAPSGKSDIYDYSLTVEADAAVSHYAFKIDSPENCNKGSGYKVESLKTPLPVAIGKRDNGPVAVCLLAYHFPSKQWLAPAEAKVFAWEKIEFKRTISAAYEEFDPFCNKNIVTTTQIEIKGDTAVYVWTRDAQAQGCDEPLDQGKDVMTIQSNDLKEMRGFWAFGGGGASGWFHFVWADKGRTTFTGNYGYGEPDLKPEGPWYSLPAPSKP